MKCKYCNRESNENSQFCIYCGMPLEAEPALKKKKMKPIFIVLIILGGLQVLSAFVIAIILAICYFLGIGNGMSFDGLFGAKKEDAIVEHDHNYGDAYYDDSYGDNYYGYDTLPSYDETAPAIVETEPAIEETKPAAPEEKSSDRVVIANGGLNLRSSPSLSSNVITLIPNGSIVTVEKVEDNWAFVCYSGKVGWCSCDYLFVPIEYPATNIYTAKVHCEGNLKMESYDYAEKDIVYTDVPNGTMVYVYEINGDRALIKYNNIYGWCYAEYLELY